MNQYQRDVYYGSEPDKGQGDEPKMVECPDCGGWGEVEAGYGEGAYDEKCKRCGGEGVTIDD